MSVCGVGGRLCVWSGLTMSVCGVGGRLCVCDNECTGDTIHCS